eukprot:2299231-Pyramimonas_sp.AAC.1
MRQELECHQVPGLIHQDSILNHEKSSRGPDPKFTNLYKEIDPGGPKLPQGLLKALGSPRVGPTEGPRFA